MKCWHCSADDTNIESTVHDVLMLDVKRSVHECRVCGYLLEETPYSDGSVQRRFILANGEVLREEWR